MTDKDVAMLNSIAEKRGPGRPPLTLKPVVVAKPAEPEKPKKFPVKLLFGYFPKDPDHPKHPLTGFPEKVERGTIVELDISEAKELIAAGKAVRADEIA